MVGDTIAYFPAVFFKLCHGTNENPSTDKLSRAINYVHIPVGARHQSAASWRNEEGRVVGRRELLRVCM